MTKTKKLTVPDILRALQSMGIDKAKLTKAVEKQNGVDPRLTGKQVKRIERMLRCNGRCALYLAATGRILLVDELQLKSRWTFNKRGGYHKNSPIGRKRETFSGAVEAVQREATGAVA